MTKPTEAQVQRAQDIVEVYARFVDGRYEVWRRSERFVAADTHALVDMVAFRLAELDRLNVATSNPETPS